MTDFSGGFGPYWHTNSTYTQLPRTGVLETQ